MTKEIFHPKPPIAAIAGTIVRRGADFDKHALAIQWNGVIRGGTACTGWIVCFWKIFWRLVRGERCSRVIPCGRSKDAVLLIINLPMKSNALCNLSASRFLRAARACIIALNSLMLAVAVFSGPATAAMPAPKEGEEAGPKDWPVNPAKHEVVIKRVATDDKQSAMIAAAEVVQAPREAVLKEAKAQDPNADANQAALPQGDKVWWYQEKLGIHIPYAITSEAIIYYSELVANNTRKIFKSYAEPSSRLEYQASVEFHKEFKLDDKTFNEVNVVTLKLSFAANFTAEATSGLSFEKTRIVVLDAGNKVLHLSGDGPTEAMIMML